MKFNDKYIKFIELRTEEEPLYLYEIYEKDPTENNNHEVPVTREFFTQEEGIRNFISIEFLNRQCKYLTQDYSIQGEWRGDYANEITPYEFLEAVGPYLKDEETFNKKKEEVLNSMRFKAKLTDYRMIKMDKKGGIPQETKDEAAKTILKKYMKIESQ